MKRTIGMFLVCILSLTACGTKNDDNFNLTANAVVTEVQEDTITVKDAEESDVFGDECIVECNGIPIIYCDYESGEVTDISVEDIVVGDEIIIGIRDSEIKKLQNGENTVKAEQIQLSTQRLNDREQTDER